MAELPTGKLVTGHKRKENRIDHRTNALNFALADADSDRDEKCLTTVKKHFDSIKNVAGGV